MFMDGSALMRLGVISLIVLLAVIVFAPRSEAHVVSRLDCHRQASQPFVNYLKTYRACIRRAKAHAINHVCAKPRPMIRVATVKHIRANRHQRRMLTIILNTGRKLGAHSRVQRSAIAATTQEASATNIRGGMGSSVGLFQLIDTWGSVEQRHNPEYSARWYFARAIPVHRGNPGISIGALSQAVERSAHPYAYDAWVGESRQTYAAFIGPCAW